MGYIERSACNGVLPAQFTGKLRIDRDGLLATLIRSRTSVRYIIAPTGFGKSNIACSYAELVDNLSSTFWLDCSNPCFFRDLDSFSLLPDLLRASQTGSLVVFDDVGSLDEDRSRELWAVCSTLVEERREVVVCTTPGADPLRPFAASCARIEGDRLLYSPAEVAMLDRHGLFSSSSAGTSGLAARIPALLPKTETGCERFLSAHIDDMPTPADVLLSFYLLVLGRASIDDLADALGHEVAASDIGASSLRPFVSVDLASQLFDATGFSLRTVLRMFSPHLERLAVEAGCKDPSEFAAQVAELLMEKGQEEKVPQLLAMLCSPAKRRLWLGQCQQQLLSRGALAQAELVYDSLAGKRFAQAADMVAGSRIRQALLYQTDEAYQDLLNAAKRADYPLDLRILAALCHFAFAPDGPEADYADAFEFSARSLARHLAALDEAQGAQLACLRMLLAGDRTASEVLEALPDGPDAMLPLACALRFARERELGKSETSKLISRARKALLGATDVPPAGTLEAWTLARELSACDSGFASEAQFGAVRESCERFSDKMEVQRHTYVKGKVAREGALAGVLGLSGTGAAHLGRDLSVPLLEVNLLGHFGMAIGGRTVQPKGFSRRKVRALLAVLVLELGHDLSCESLCRRLWPDSPYENAVHNLYNTVSILRKGITLADGTCPYLHRPHGAICLEKNLVRSDVDQLKTLCTKLRLEDPGASSYLVMGERLAELYQGELLPSTHNEPVIVAERGAMRARVANTFLLVSRKLSSVGNDAAALYFAQKAHAADPTREDCYEQLMLAQARGGQRPAAIDTWLNYRNYLNDELGLDPSQRIEQLYESIIAE